MERRDGGATQDRWRSRRAHAGGSAELQRARGAFVRSIKTECLDPVIPVGEWHLRCLVREFVEHYHHERNHQGIGNELIERSPARRRSGPVRRRQRVGGILSYYYRSAA